MRESEEMKIFTSTLTHHCFVPGVDTYGGESHGDTESAKSPRESLSVERLFGTDLLLPCLASMVETPGHDPTPKLHGSSRATLPVFFRVWCVLMSLLPFVFSLVVCP